MLKTGENWTFEDSCEVYCNPSEPREDLARRLEREVGAIDAARAAIAAAVDGPQVPTFPGPKWEELVRRALAGECKCSG